MKLILDSSIFISYLNKNDSMHVQTANFMHKILDDKKIEIILPMLVLLEVVNVLSQQVKDLDQEILLELFSKYEKVDINTQLVKKLAPLFKDINLKTSDATIVGIAKLMRVSLITWDKQLIRRISLQIIIKSPDDCEEILTV